MTSTILRRAMVPGVAAMTVFALTACGASNEESDATDSGTDGGSGETTSLAGDLNGAGASSQEKAQEAWATGFQGQNPDVTVNYNAIGSGDGRKQFIEGGTLFAGTDSYFKDDEGELTAAKERCNGEDIIEVPAYISPIAVVYNLPEVPELKLDADTTAKIFDGKITKWNDPAIAALNEGAKLPDTAITPVHRQDDSGTTKNFTDYLGKAAPDSWSYEAEDAFPVKGGVSAEGTSGVVSAVQNGEGTIGYADESQAGELGKVSIKVGEEFVAPSAEGAAKMVPVSTPVEGAAETQMVFDIDRTTTEAGAYPVVLISYLAACQHYDSEDEANLVKGYLTYIVSEEGQQAAADNAGSAPLDSATSEQATAIVEVIAAK